MNIDHPLMEFYAGGQGDLRVRVWDHKGDHIVWLSQPDAKKVIDYIIAYSHKSKDALILSKLESTVPIVCQQ